MNQRAHWICHTICRLACGAWLICIGALMLHRVHAAEDTARAELVQAMASEDVGEQKKLIANLITRVNPEILELIRQWREGGIYLMTMDDGQRFPIYLDDAQNAEGMSTATYVLDGKPVVDAAQQKKKLTIEDLETLETSSALRRQLKEVTDAAALTNPSAAKRLRAVQDCALEQNPEKIPLLERMLAQEKDASVKKALLEAIAFCQLVDPAISVRIEACDRLGRLGSIAARQALETVKKKATDAGEIAVVDASAKALKAIDQHIARANAVGTLFRGVSLGSVLLVVAIGLAITFGLMGVINMAHGELIAVGAYTTYVMQNVFDKGLKLSPFGKSLELAGLHLGESGSIWYFVAALPASFLMAALVGLLMERSVIQFLYRRPLESLLATWGLSLLFQQVFRLVFGANNVQVSSPPWLSGNWTFSDVVLGWNRVFVIVFACAIILVTWLVLNKTALGLLIRAVMQNRNMAACMGIKTERVNMLTFAFGSGLAGLAGAFLSQIGNVGPSLGQNYIVDSFMTVVVGGVGNLFGTVISSIGIGMLDQFLQQYLGNPVIGKIIVLAMIILFLQWRPAGLFVTRSRSLD